MKAVLIIVTLVAFAAATPTIKERWASFKAQHGKSYNSIEEEQRRMAIFSKKQIMIEEHNAKYEAGLSTYYLGMNEFGDKLPEEVASMRFNATRVMTHVPITTFVRLANVDTENSVNWRESGAVTPVKFQGNCRSGWAFSSIGAIEGQYFRNSKTLTSFSAQQLIDCTQVYDNHGCDGGWMVNSFKYLEKVDGLETEVSYPYRGEEGECKYNNTKVVSGTKVIAYTFIQEGNDDDLLAAVAVVGPVTAFITSRSDEFLHYKGGIFQGDTCTGEDRYAMLVVGYGSDAGKKYWLLKNSMGSGWGEGGYMKLTRDKKNACGISTLASYPSLK